MKKSFIFIFLIALGALAGCSKDEELILESEKIIIGPDETRTIPIKSGNGNYKLNISDNSILEAFVKEGNIHINGKSTGTAVVQVVDREGKTAEITVYVDNVKMRMNNYFSTTTPNHKDTIHIHYGNGGYSVDYDKSIIEVEVQGDYLIITGKNEGLIYITVRDRFSNTRKIEAMVLPDSYTDLIYDPTERFEGENISNSKDFSIFRYASGYCLGWTGREGTYLLYFDDYTLGSKSKHTTMIKYGNTETISLDRITILKRTRDVWLEYEKDGKVYRAVGKGCGTVGPIPPF